MVYRRVPCLALSGLVAYGLVACGLVACGLVACGGATEAGRRNVPRTMEVGGDGLPTPEENRNGAPPVSLGDEEPEEAIVLYCEEPSGTACGAAQRELGIGATPSELVPSELLRGPGDGGDACGEPSTAELMQRLRAACGLSREASQESRTADVPLPATREALDQPEVGSGCAVFRRLEPRIMIHSTPHGAGPRHLVRVWEAQPLS
ncbi:MAG: hypothetical protein AB7S26_10570 [Sandaracinaceae bacterium]